MIGALNLHVPQFGLLLSDLKKGGRYLIRKPVGNGTMEERQYFSLATPPPEPDDFIGPRLPDEKQYDLFVRMSPGGITTPTGIPTDGEAGHMVALSEVALAYIAEGKPPKPLRVKTDDNGIITFPHIEPFQVQRGAETALISLLIALGLPLHLIIPPQRDQ